MPQWGGVAALLVEQRAVQALERPQRPRVSRYWRWPVRIEISPPASEVLARGDIGELFLGRRVTQP